MGRKPHTRLAGECLQPLGHLSLGVGVSLKARAPTSRPSRVAETPRPPAWVSNRQQAAPAGVASPALQILLYPVTDALERRRAHELFGEGFFLTGQMNWFERLYVVTPTGPIHA